MNKKNTKRALLLSALSLLMCVSMLIGTTFAWFTDSVTSGGNTIQSGKLDVDLVDADDNSLAGKQLTFKTADDQYDKDAIYADAYITDAAGLADAIANAKDGDTIALMDDITVSDALRMNKSYNLELNGHTLYLNTTKESYIYRSSTVTFRNGTVDISNAVVPGKNGIFYFANGESGHADGNGAQGNTLTFDNVKLVGDGYSAYSVMTIRNGAEDKHNVLNFIDSTVELKNEARTDGGFIKHPGTTTSYAFVNIINTKIDCQNVTRLFLYGVYNIKDSTIDFIDTTGTSNGFRQGTFTIDNSKVTIKGGDKGISPRFADTVIKNGSVFTIDNVKGNDVIFEYDFNIRVDSTSSLTYNATSGDGNGSVIVEQN